MQPKGLKREQQTMMMLKKFKSKMYSQQKSKVFTNYKHKIVQLQIKLNIQIIFDSLLQKKEMDIDGDKEINDDNWLRF